MKNTNQPPFTINIEILDLVAKIIEATAKFTITHPQSIDLHLRKNNRIRSIHSSLAIENNSLSIEQVTDIINGKLVKGKQEEIKEVKNAYAAYDEILTYDPFSVTDFLKAHDLLTQGLVEESGKFRSGDVGIYAGEQLIHAGARPIFVPQLIADLFAFGRKSELHPLVLSSIIHFEIEFIHPFSDGNGRMGRLWQTLILSKWNELFQWLPMETVIFDNQQLYYEKLGESDKLGESTPFVTFMLQTLLTTIEKNLNNDTVNDTQNETLNEQVWRLIKINPKITITQIMKEIGKSRSTVSRCLKQLKEEGKIRRVGSDKSGEWEVGNK